MQGINCIKGEIHNVLTVLRLNSQSGNGGAHGGAQMELEEHQLIRGLKDLYEHICMHSDLAHVDTLSYLTPFLTVITSKHTDILTTAIALHSIHKFLVYGLIHSESPNVASALTELANSVTHCTFDVTDGEDAEVVSMKILEILLECLRCTAGELLTDQAVLDMVTEAFHVRAQQHSSKLLRRYAENVLMQMVLVLFARISPESSNANELYASRAASPSPSPLLRSSSGAGPAGQSASPSPYRMQVGSSSRHRSLSVHSTIKDWSTSTELQMQSFNASAGTAQHPISDDASPPTSAHAYSSAPYGIPALHRVFRFLTNLINPGDARNSEQDRILGLRLIRTVLETSSSRIGSFPPLICVIQEELCLAKGTLVNTEAGVAVPIESVSVGTRVASLADASSPLRGLVNRPVSHVVSRGVRDCIELLFADGRTLTCTPDHRMLCSDGKWIPAGELIVGKSAVAASMDLARQDASQDAADTDSAWRLDLQAQLGFELSVAAPAQLTRSCAFARLAGLSLSSDFSWNLPHLSLCHAVDVESVHADLCALNVATSAPHWQGSSCCIVKPSHAFGEALQSVGLHCCSDSARLTSFPAAFTSPLCPLTLQREFLGGLFGGDTRAPADALTTEGCCVRWTMRKAGSVAREQLRVLHSALLPMLVRCGVPADSISFALLDSCDKTRSRLIPLHEQLLPNGSYTLQLRVAQEGVLAFSAGVGYRHNVRQQLRLTAMTAWLRGHDFVRSQRERVRAVAQSAIDDRGLSISPAVEWAKAQLAKTETLHPYTLRWAPTHPLHFRKPVPRDAPLSLQRAVDSWGLASFLSPDASSSSASTLPLFSLPLVSKRCVGPTPVFDLTVPVGESFTANGLGVHNCKYLLQNSQTKNLLVLSLTLRLVFDLFVTVKQHLSVQLEVFFTSIHLRIGESPSSSYAQRELVLESLVEFCNEVSLIVGLYRNYDCELGCTDLFQDLCKFLAQTAMQWGTPTPGKGAVAPGSMGQPSHLNLLSLEGMVGVLNAIVKRFCSNYHAGQGAGLGGVGAQLTDPSRPPSGLPPPPSGMRMSPALTPSHASNPNLSSFLPNGYSSSAGDESDDEGLILNPEEEAHLLNKRANKQKLAMAAEQFNREGLNAKTVKLLQTLKILPPSVAPATTTATEEGKATAGTNGHSAGNTPPSSTSNSASSSSSTPTSSVGDGSTPRAKGPPPVVKSKHDFGVPPMSIVHFFRNTPGLDKGKIGAYLGDADPFNIRVLDAFVESFDFTQAPRTLPPAHASQQQPPASQPAEGRGSSSSDPPASSSASDASAAPAKPEISLDDALRSFLDCFLLPGESQQIARIIERFSEAYFRCCAGPLRTSDAAYVLCYSVIMLNTDAHNPQVTRKMNKESYIRNLRGINCGADLPREYLENLFDSIVHNEIKLTSDNLKDLAGGHGAADQAHAQSHIDARWNRVLRNRASGPQGAGATNFHINAPRIHGREMFVLIWQSCISIFTHYIEHTCPSREGWMSNLQVEGGNGGVDSSTSLVRAHTGASLPSLPASSYGISGLHLKVLPKVLQGLSLFCRVCAVYSLHDILNHAIIALCNTIVHLLEELCLEANWEPKEMAISFARDQRLTSLLTLQFQLLHEYAEMHVLESWSNVLHVLLWLREMELLPASFVEMEDFRDSTGRPLESLRGGAVENTHFSSRGPVASRRLARSRKAKEEHATAAGGAGIVGSIFSWGGFFRGSTGSGPEGQAQQQSQGGGSGPLVSPVSNPPVHSPAELYWLAKCKEIINACNIPMVFENSKYFRPGTLAHLVRALTLLSSAGTQHGSSISLSAFSPHILHEESAVFCLERLADVTEKNQSRLNIAQALTPHQSSSAPLASVTTPSSPAITSGISAPVSSAGSPTTLHLWSTVSQHFDQAIANVRGDPACTFYVERLVVNLLRFSVRLVYSPETTSQLIALLSLLLQLPRNTFSTLAPRIIAGTSLFLQTHGESIRSVREWETILSLLGQFKHHPLSAHAAFTTLVYVVDNHASQETFAPFMQHVTKYALPEEQATLNAAAGATTPTSAQAQSQAWMPVAPEAVISLLLKLHGKLVSLPMPEPSPPSSSSSHSLPSQLHHESLHQRSLLSPAQIARRQNERERMRTDLWLGSIQNLCNLIRNDARGHVRKAALDALNKSDACNTEGH